MPSFAAIRAFSSVIADVGRRDCLNLMYSPNAGMSFSGAMIKSSRSPVSGFGGGIATPVAMDAKAMNAHSRMTRLTIGSLYRCVGVDWRDRKLLRCRRPMNGLPHVVIIGGG